MAVREIDVGVIGATGFTGKLACAFARELNLKRVQRGAAVLKFAFCGRDGERLAELVAESGPREEDPPETKKALEGAFKAAVCKDFSDEASLDAIVKTCKAVISFAGPFVVCGESVLSSCLRCGTHYADITAELGWVKRMELKYGPKLAEAKLKAVPCSGYDFIPNDMLMLQLGEVMNVSETLKKWGGAESMLSVTHAASQSTPMVSGGTAYSALMMARSYETLYEALTYWMNPYWMLESSPSAKKLSNFSLPQLLTHPGNYFQPLPLAPAQPVSSLRVIEQASEKELPVDKTGATCSPLCKAMNAEYCVNFCMSSLMTKYVHWINEIQDFRFGKKLRYFGGELRKNTLWAYLWSVMVWLGFSYVLVISRLPLQWAKRLIPAVGEGPQLKPNEDYTFAQLRACWPAGEVRLKWRMAGGESYVFAAKSGILVAAALAEGQKLPERYGMLPASIAVGPPLLDSLTTYANVEMSAAQVSSY